MKRFYGPNVGLEGREFLADDKGIVDIPDEVAVRNGDALVALGLTPAPDRQPEPVKEPEPKTPDVDEKAALLARAEAEGIKLDKRRGLEALQAEFDAAMAARGEPSGE